MYKLNYLACLLIAVCYVGGCRKGIDKNEMDFYISVVGDVNLGKTASSYLDVYVDKTTGIPEPVVLTVEGLPEGASVHISANNQAPPYNARLQFKDDSTFRQVADTGIIKVTAATGSKQLIREFKLIAPPFSGFVVDGIVYRTEHVLRESGKYRTFLSVDHGGATMIATTPGMLWPENEDSTYLFTIDGLSGCLSCMDIQFIPGGTADTFKVGSNTGVTATLKASYQAQHFELRFSNLKVHHSGHGDRIISGIIRGY